MTETQVQYPGQFMVVQQHDGKYELTAKDENQKKYPASWMVLDNDEFRHEAIKGIRFADVDGRKFFSVRDTIMIVTKCSLVRASEIRTREMSEFFSPGFFPGLQNSSPGFFPTLQNSSVGNFPILESGINLNTTGIPLKPNDKSPNHLLSKPETTNSSIMNSTILKKLQFSGKWEKFQDCLPLSKLFEMIQSIPSGKACKQFRQLCAQQMMRYLAGDESLVNEIHNNASCQSLLNEAAREELPHAQMDAIREEIREEREEREPQEQTIAGLDRVLGKHAREEAEASLEVYKKINENLEPMIRSTIAFTEALVQHNPHYEKKIDLRRQDLQVDREQIQVEKEKISLGKIKRREDMSAAKSDIAIAKLRLEKTKIDLQIRDATRELQPTINQTVTVSTQVQTDPVSSAPPNVSVNTQVQTTPAPSTVPSASAQPVPTPVARVTTTAPMTLDDLAKLLNLTNGLTDDEIDRINHKIGAQFAHMSRVRIPQRGLNRLGFNPVMVQEQFIPLFKQMAQRVIDEKKRT